jgi:hypothetical protein
MTPKTMKSSRNPINRAQMERIFAASLPLDSRLQLSVRQRSSSAQHLIVKAELGRWPLPCHRPNIKHFNNLQDHGGYLSPCKYKHPRDPAYCKAYRVSSSSPAQLEPSNCAEKGIAHGAKVMRACADSRRARGNFRLPATSTPCLLCRGNWPRSPYKTSG